MALSRIPKDEKGEPIYEQTDASTAWDGLIEQTEGDEEMAHEVAEDMVKEKTADLEKAEKEPISQGKTPAEKIAARKAHKAKIEQAKQELEHWKAIANVQAERKAETEQQEAEKVKAEEAKENYCCPVKIFRIGEIRADTSHEVSALLVIFVLLLKNI